MYSPDPLQSNSTFTPDGGPLNKSFDAASNSNKNFVGDDARTIGSIGFQPNLMPGGGFLRTNEGVRIFSREAEN